RSTIEYNDIEYIYIDDPISSLDDNHVVDVGVDIKKLLSKSENESLKFVVSTHHSLFYNILYNEFNQKDIKGKKVFYTFSKDELNYYLKEAKDSPFGYHLLIKDEIQKAIQGDKIEKYHFALFRNLLEKTSNYLGYQNWSDCLVGEGIQENQDAYARRINLYSHNKHSDLEGKELQPQEKEILKLLFSKFIEHFKWNKEI
ncbi:MAG: AAA family ATPase, partial [Bacilli bacterium]